MEKSAEFISLDTALAGLWRTMERLEKRLANEEEQYIQSTRGNPQDLNPPFGNLMSGWELILEGVRPDVHKGKERIYSRACFPFPFQPLC